MGYGSARLWEKNPNSLQIEKFPTKSKKILKNLNHLLTWMEFLNDPLLYFIVPKTIKMSCMMRAKKAISLAAARGVIVAPACNSGVQRLKNDGVATNTQARIKSIIASENLKRIPGITWGEAFLYFTVLQLLQSPPLVLILFKKNIFIF